VTAPEASPKERATNADTATTSARICLTENIPVMPLGWDRGEVRTR
jgi:hypothetical protein